MTGDISGSDDVTILYIEDNLDNRILIRRVLEAEGFRVLEAGNAYEAMKVFQYQIPDLILMDINMPDVDGYTFTAQLKRLPTFQQIPIIAITANAMKGDQERSIQAGCDAYIQKPVDIDHLSEQILGLLQNFNQMVTDRFNPTGPDHSINPPVLTTGSTTTSTAMKGATVLVVEDNVSNFVLIARMLGYMGIHCEWKTSGYEVVEYADTLPSLDLILMDIRLPYEDGYGALQKIRTSPNLRGTRVVAVTAETGIDQMNRARLAGFDGFIGKPLDPDRFPDQIRRILTGEAVWELG